MQAFAAELGHPERQFPSIHVAGTNGKGSVCALLEAMYRNSGLRTGMYTSPHLIHQGERVQVNRENLNEAAIVQYTQTLKASAEALAAKDPEDYPSFFEFMTAMAFLRFAEAKVDIALIETGLGGRLDATNVLTPQLSIITTISLDHTELLGNSLEAIAREKAGILKPKVPALIGWLEPEAEQVIRAIAKERNCPLYSARERFPESSKRPQTNLIGAYQGRNTALALYATEILEASFPTDSETNKEALQNVIWRGRWERLELGGRTLILDAAHNAEGMRELDINLTELTEASGRKPILIAAATSEARADALIPVLEKHAAKIYLMRPEQEKALPTAALRKRISQAYTAAVIETEINELFPTKDCCTAGNPGDIIVVTGSLYLIGEVLERLHSDSPSQQSKLQDYR